MKFSNPRKSAVITNWPLGGSKRGTATFQVEANNRGERVLRTTTGKAKATTYYKKIVIVDGEDGRTYILGLCNDHQIAVIFGDMKATSYSFSQDPQFNEIKELIENCQPVAA